MNQSQVYKDGIFAFPLGFTPRVGDEILFSLDLTEVGENGYAQSLQKLWDSMIGKTFVVYRVVVEVVKYDDYFPNATTKVYITEKVEAHNPKNRPGLENIYFD